MSSRGSRSGKSRSRGRGRGNARSSASQSSNSQTADAPEAPNQTTTLQDDLVAATAEIEQLRAQLAARDSPAPVPVSPNLDRLATVLEAFSERLDRIETRASTPASGARKSTKLPDPPILTDGKDPAFGRWRIQMQDKLKVNSDHFESMEAKMAYVFNRTGDDAQGHLEPRYEGPSTDPFLTSQSMIDFLATIYEDPYKVQNARLEYKSLSMKSTETFSDFHTRFLQLAGQAKIPSDDLRPDLFDKLTLELQKTVLPVYTTLSTEKALADQCVALDHGLRRIKARSDQAKARITSSGIASSGTLLAKPLPASAIPSRTIPREPTPGRYTREATPDRTTRPQTKDTKPSANTDQVTCYSCGQKGHYAPDCLQKEKIIAEVEQPTKQFTDSETDSGKEEP
jgi:hypothetical protein